MPESPIDSEFFFNAMFPLPSRCCSSSGLYWQKLWILRLQSSVSFFFFSRCFGGSWKRVPYFWMKKQKLNYLNGQIAEDRLIPRGVGQVVPVVADHRWKRQNLIFAVTPAFFWAASTRCHGKILFAVKKISQCFLILLLSSQTSTNPFSASFRQLADRVPRGYRDHADSPKKVFLARHSRGLGRSRWPWERSNATLICAETTKRLMMALGRSRGFELDRGEAEAESQGRHMTVNFQGAR